LRLRRLHLLSEFDCARRHLRRERRLAQGSHGRVKLFLEAFEGLIKAIHAGSGGESAVLLH
jgi:hypothetical protein